MENFQNKLSYNRELYSRDLRKTSQADASMFQSAVNSNLSESDGLISVKSPIIPFNSVYQPSGLQSISVHPALHPQGSSIKYSDKNLETSSNLHVCRIAGLDMTNKIPTVNMIHKQTNCSVSDSKTKSYISAPVSTSQQVITSSFSKCEQLGDIQVQNYDGSIINMSATDNSINKGSIDSESYVPCEEKLTANCVYKCGGCEENFYTICKLHAHIKTHNENGSYYFSESTKTAYPKFVTHCKGTQTSHKSHTKYSTHLNEDLNTIINNNVKDTQRPRVDKNNLMTNVANKTIEDEPEIKIEEEEPDVHDIRGGVSDSGSDTDEYKPEESILLDRKKKISKRKRNEVNKVNTKRSKKLKKLKMTIKLKQEGRKENRVSFVKKGRKSKRSNSTDEKRPKSEEKITCKLCKEEFTKRLFLRHHIKTRHSDVEHLCQLCGEQFTADKELIEHRKIVHNRGYHQCELCDKVLSTKGMLEGHYLVHKGIKPFSCDICVPKKEFTRKCQLKAHMDTHSSEKTLQCEFCGKPFNARYLMLSHVKHCGGIKPHKCEYCEMSFVSNHCLQRHRRTHTGEKPFVCEVCAFASSNASCLARHMRTHTGEKPFTCQFCQQTFAARGALKKHVRIHTQEKPYKCRYCTKAFTQNWNLKTHERQHTGETPYKCHVCGIGYKQNVLLKTHMRTHFGQTSESSESQNLTVNQSVSQSLTENQPNLNIQPHSSAQSTFKSESLKSEFFKPDSLKSEFLESQSVNNQSHLTELNSQQLVPNILLSSFLHSGYNMNL